ncbi:beta-alanyl-bioamine nonribosomal peptide synthetase ebony-like isoform X2 [Oratosquilla oratoria]
MAMEGTQVAFPRSWPEVVPRFLEFSSLARPFAPALCDVRGDYGLSYQQLNQKANKLARVLLRRLLSGGTNADGDRVVGVCMSPSPQLVLTLVAIHKAGAAYLPLDVEFPETRVAHILQDCRPSLVVTRGQPENVANAPTQYNVPTFEYQLLEDEAECENGGYVSEDEVGLRMTGESVAMVLYTSGSTGVPKGVRVPHRAVLNRLLWQWSTFPYARDEVCCFKTALTFVDSVSEIFGPLLTGHKLVVIPKCITRAVDELVAVLDRERIGRLVLVPSLLRSILLHCTASSSAPKLSHLRLWVCSGEVFTPDLLRSFFTIFKEGQTICNFYGSTEVMGDVTYIRFCSAKDAEDKLHQSKVPIGGPVTGCRIYLLDRTLSPATEGQAGEIFAAGANLALGYVGQVEKDKFIDNPHSNNPDFAKLYRTGDFGRIARGLLMYEGRTDSQVKIRGHRVDLSEVHAAIQAIPGVSKSYVLCYKPGEVNQALVAFYVSPVEELSPALLKVQVAFALAPYMQPTLFRVDDLPLLVNGKVDRQKLLRMFEKEANTTKCLKLDLTGCPEDKEDEGKALLQTISRILGPSARHPIQLGTNFFDAGGNSLNAVLTVTSLRDLGYHVGMSDFLRAERLKDVLRKMTRVEGEGRDPAEGSQLQDEHHYVTKPLKEEYKERVINILAESFQKKGDLEQWVDTTEEDYKDLLSEAWPELINQDLSFVVFRRASDKDLLAVSLNYDLYAEPELECLSPAINKIFAFLESCEAPVRQRLPQGVGTVMHSFMMTTSPRVSPGENVVLIQVMEERNLKMAKEKDYQAVFTTNTSELTQHVCDDLLHYTVLADYQVNLWTAPDGTQPFAKALDTQRAVCTVKYI